MRSINSFGMIPSQLLVLRELHRRGGASRVEIAEATGLSTQSLTRITKQLMDDKLIVEGNRVHRGRGQPAIFLSLAPATFITFGLVLEHDKITCVMSDLCGDQLFYQKRQGDFAKADVSIREAEAMLATAYEQAPPDAYTLGVGISISGFFIDDDGRKLISRNDIEGWKAIDLRNPLSLPIEMPVFIENDGLAAAIGTAVDGVGKNLESFFLILLTKGIGGGFVSQGRVLRGKQGNAGEISNFIENSPSLKRPTLETLNIFLSEHWGKIPSESELEAALVKKDPILLEWINMAAESLQPALKAICALLDPEAIILAGRMPHFLRTEISAKLNILSANYRGFTAPAPTVIVDSQMDCLVRGATALPVSAFLYEPTSSFNSGKTQTNIAD